MAKSFLMTLIVSTILCNRLINPAWSSPSSITEEKVEKKLCDEIQTAISSLGCDYSFEMYNFQLSNNEVKALKNITILSTDEYNNYGNLSHLESEARKFIKSLGKGNETSAKEVAKL